MDYDFLKSLVPMDKVEAFRQNALNPHGNSVTRGGAENDDINFQGREAQNEHFAVIPDVAAKYMGANRQQCLNALVEAESYKGPSLVIAYCPCQEHGIKGSLSTQQQVQKNAVACGYTTLYRFDPRKDKPLTIDSKEPDWTKFKDFLMNEARYFNLPKLKGEEVANQMFDKTLHDAQVRYQKLVTKEKMQ